MGFGGGYGSGQLGRELGLPGRSKVQQSGEKTLPQTYVTDCHGPLSEVSCSIGGRVRQELALLLLFSTLSFTRFGLTQPCQFFCLVAWSICPTSIQSQSLSPVKYLVVTRSENEITVEKTTRQLPQSIDLSCHHLQWYKLTFSPLSQYTENTSYPCQTRRTVQLNMSTH